MTEPNTDAINLVRQLARMVTPTDADQLQAYAEAHGQDVADLDPEEVLSDMEGDRAFDDACASYHLIREAREIVARLDVASPSVAPASDPPAKVDPVKADMLAALKAAQNGGYLSDDTADMVAAAIARAEGRA